MNALELLQQRVSSPVLTAPEPDLGALQEVMKAALRAPDHGLLRPWRFLVISGDSRVRLGELFAAAALRDHPEYGDAELQRFQQMPLRAPMLIIAIARTQEHPKVPVTEQLISAGAAVLNMELALMALGYGSMWRTGPMAYDADVKQGLDLDVGEEIVGFLYVGTPAGKIKDVPALQPQDFFKHW